MSLKAFLKKLIIILPISVVIGAFIGAFLGLLNEEQGNLGMSIFQAILITGVIAYILYIMYKYFSFANETKRLLKIMYEEIDIERYLAETQAAIKRTRNKLYKFHFSLNMAVGLHANGENDSAINYMKKLSVKDTSWVYKAIYYNNITFFYCDKDDLQNANETFTLGEKYIRKVMKNPLHSAAFTHTLGALEYLRGNLSRSEELLEKCKQQMTANNFLVSSANLYLAKIYLKTGQIEKAKLLVDYNLSQKLMPNVAQETKKMKELI